MLKILMYPEACLEVARINTPKNEVPLRGEAAHGATAF